MTKSASTMQRMDIEAPGPLNINRVCQCVNSCQTPERDGKCFICSKYLKPLPVIGIKGLARDRSRG